MSSLLCLLGNILFPFVCINPHGLGSHCMIQQVVIVIVVIDFDVQVAPNEGLFLCLPQDSSHAFCFLWPPPHQSSEATYISSDICERRPCLPWDLEVGNSTPGENWGSSALLPFQNKLLTTFHPMGQRPKDCHWAGWCFWIVNISLLWHLEK